MAWVRLPMTDAARIIARKVFPRDSAFIAAAIFKKPVRKTSGAEESGS